MLEMPPEVHEGRVRMEMTSVSNIKKVEYECANICEESLQVWTKIMGDLKYEGHRGQAKRSTRKSI
jgi:hypothetical protein